MNKHERATLANRTKAHAGAIAYAYRRLSEELRTELQHLTTQQRAQLLASLATDAVRMGSAPTGYPTATEAPHSAPNVAQGYPSGDGQ